MKPIRTFTVVPTLPERLQALRALSYNLHWAWHHDTTNLFRRGDDDLWRQSGHNPVRILGMVEQAQIEAAAADEGFLAHLDRVAQDLYAYLRGESIWFDRTQGHYEGPLVAYFSAEFGLTECLSDLRRRPRAPRRRPPEVGQRPRRAAGRRRAALPAGLLSASTSNESGWQQERYVDNDFHNLPLTLERGRGRRAADDRRRLPWPAASWPRSGGRRWAACRCTCSTPTWRATPRGPRHHRPALRRRYRRCASGRRSCWASAGYRALEALGLRAARVPHERGPLRLPGAGAHAPADAASAGSRFAEAREVASAGLVFTTHTPVAAGHDHFPPELMDRYFGRLRREPRALAPGVPRPRPPESRGRRASPSCMTVLALRLAALRNGVSQLHGEVTPQMWQRHLARRPGGRRADRARSPTACTSARGSRTRWTSLYDRYLGPRWREEPADAPIWRAVRRAFPTRSCGAPTSAGASGWSPSRAGACARSSSGAARTAPRSTRPARCSTRTR